MLKKISGILVCLFIIATGKAQIVGYSTTDFGAEAQWQSSGGYTGVMHLAFNAPLHSGFQLRAGYNIVRRENWGDQNAVENGSGPGGGIGYRYYFPYKPNRLFLGVRADIWRLKIDWSDIDSLLNKGTSKTWTAHPAAELGYMFLINDLAFITPAVSAGYISNISTDGADVGQGFVFTAGISAGIRF